MTPRAFGYLALPAALLLGACDSDSDPVVITDEENIIAVAQSAGTFNTLLTALDVAGLTSALESGGPFTVFAPTDDAFAALDPEVLSDLLADADLLTAVLTYHVVPGSFSAETVLASVNSSLPTLNGKLLDITMEGSALRAAEANITATDFRATNGVVHVIDRVILPEPIADLVQTARGAGVFNTLLTALDVGELTAVLKGEGPFTVFAPSDEAFARIPAEDLSALLADKDALTAVLTYHVVLGALSSAEVLASTSLTTVNGASASISLDEEGNPRIAGAIITATDIGARNGVVHIIDRVIFPN